MKHLTESIGKTPALHKREQVTLVGSQQGDETNMQTYAKHISKLLDGCDLQALSIRSVSFDIA